MCRTRWLAWIFSGGSPTNRASDESATPKWGGGGGKGRKIIPLFFLVKIYFYQAKILTSPDVPASRVKVKLRTRILSWKRTKTWHCQRSIQAHFAWLSKRYFFPLPWNTLPWNTLPWNMTFLEKKSILIFKLTHSDMKQHKTSNSIEN